MYSQKSVLHLERFMKDKVVIITGASSGIGKALAFSFGREGAKIIITGRKETSLMEVSQELSKAGIENFALVSDVSIEAENIEMVEKTSCGVIFMIDKPLMNFTDKSRFTRAIRDNDAFIG